jgi:hypothetical protein
LECREIDTRRVGAFDARAIGFVKHPGGKLLGRVSRQVETAAAIYHAIAPFPNVEQMDLAPKPGMFGIPHRQSVAAVRIMTA